MGEILTIECIDGFDPKIVRVSVRSPDGQVYSLDIRNQDYAILAMLPGFPPNPCDGK